MTKRTLGAVAAALLVAASASVRAATPTDATLGPASGAKVAWDFAAVGPGIAAAGTVERQCLPVYCDAFALHVALPGGAAFYADNEATLKITYTWNSTGPNDMDVFAFSPKGTENGPGEPDDASTGPGIEVLNIANPEPGDWKVVSEVGITPEPTAAHAVAELSYKPAQKFALPVLPPDAPRFTAGNPPVGYQNADILRRTNGGEPSLGVDWKTGAVMYMAGTQISRVTFDAAGKATWTDVTPAQQAVVNEDEAIFVDPQTGRTFAEGLLAAGSLGTYSDDDGASWQQMEGSGFPHGPDHETVGGGPYAGSAPALNGVTGYSHAVYYCSQNVVKAAGAFCSRSDTGGLIFNPSTKVFGTTTPCTSIHGHIKVGSDGTVYVPNRACTRPDGKTGQGMGMSTDNGQTWTYPVVPDSLSPSTGFDPSVGVGSKNTVYLGMEGGDGHPRIAVSHDHGATWSKSIDVGAAYHIRNTKMPAVVAGDDDRAAFAFLGTTSGGDDQDLAFPGVWYLYISYTYDGGKTWTTVNATPDDPVQRGCIWTGGGSNACRNLLDFNDATVDKDGRVLVAFTDGCVDTDMSYSSLAGGAQGQVHGPSRCKSKADSYQDTDKVAFSALARQSCGKGLFAAKDPGFTSGCPSVAKRSTSVLGVHKTKPRTKAAGKSLPSTGAESTVLLGAFEVAAAVLLRRRMGRSS